MPCGTMFGVANGGVSDRLQPGFGMRKNFGAVGSNIGPVGRAFADTMLEISGKNSRVLPPKFNGFAPPNVGK